MKLLWLDGADLTAKKVFISDTNSERKNGDAVVITEHHQSRIKSYFTKDRRIR